MIRPAWARDAGALLDIYSPFIVGSAVSFELEPPSVEELARRMASGVWRVHETDGAVDGYAYASEHRARRAYRWSVEVSVYIDRKRHRRGIGRALYLHLFELLRGHGYVNAYAGITLPNASSVGLHEALGFAPVGVYRSVGYKLGAWHDVGWWHLPLQPPPAHPEIPTPLSAL